MRGSPWAVKATHANGKEYQQIRTVAASASRWPRGAPLHIALPALAQASPISALSIGEIEAGVERQRSQNPAFAVELEQWLCVQTGNKGIDKLIAATAPYHNLTLVTRNAKHFEPTGARVFNPFSAAA